MSDFPETFVVLPAAGCGMRMGLDTPKQYFKILNKPLICYTVEAFVSIPWVKKVVIVAAADFMQQMSEILHLSSDRKEKVLIVEGSDTRHKSIYAGLKSIIDFNPQIIVVHDAVRPFVPQDVLLKVVIAARDHGAAGIVCPLVSTVISVNEHYILAEALDRSKYKASEMPQAFQYSVIGAAYSRCSQRDMEYGTECLYLVQKYVKREVKLIDGTTDLWKVTHRKDLYAAEGVIKEKRTVAIIDRTGRSEFLDTLKDALSERFCNVAKIEEDNEYFPLIAKVYQNEAIGNIIEEINVLHHFKKSEQFRAIVYIILNLMVNDNQNFWLLQNKVRKIAEQTKSKALAFYVIVTSCITKVCSQTIFSSNSLVLEDLTCLEDENLRTILDQRKELYQEASEMASSLLFDCNLCLSGQILCL